MHQSICCFLIFPIVCQCDRDFFILYIIIQMIDIDKINIIATNKSSKNNDKNK